MWLGPPLSTTLALLPGSPVFVSPTSMVSDNPIGPVGPTSPCSPFGPVGPKPCSATFFIFINHV